MPFAAALIPLITYGAAGASLAATGYSMYAQNKAAKNAAGVDNAVADYNARTDEAMARQLDLDTLQNIRTERAEDTVYLSKQAASYAAAGVLATTGSPLAAQITNAGRMEQQLQQQYVDSQQKQAQYRSAGRVGQLEGQAQASADRLGGTLALINGASRMAGSAFNMYQSGTFSGLGSTKKTAPGLDVTGK